MYFRNINHNYLLFLLTFRLKFRGGNYDRSGIHSSPTKAISDTPLVVYPLRGALAKNARVARDDTICAKNSTFGYFDGTNPITVKGLQLWSFLPRFAPEATLRCLLSHSSDLTLISRGQNS